MLQPVLGNVVRYGFTSFHFLYRASSFNGSEDQFKIMVKKLPKSYYLYILL